MSFSGGARFAIDSTTIAGNVSGSWPGGLLAAGSDGTITNTTLSGNQAGGDGVGGAMTFLGANVDLRHLTITGNRSTAISGIASFNGSNVSIGASLVDNDCEMEPGGLVSAGGNLATGTTCGLALSSDRQGVPRAAVALQPLAENGGETPTHAIDFGSAAIGQVPSVPINLCESTDQRNTGRVPFRCDAGAFQSMPACTPGNFIGDDGETLTSVIDRSGEAGEISNVDVYLDIFHETISDLIIELVHRKSGISRTLVNRPLSVEPPFDDCTGNTLRTVLSDSAEDLDLVDESCNDDGVTFPRTRYRPPQTLAAFAGESMDTSWELRVTDIITGDTGLLREWCVLARSGGIFADGFE